MVISTLLACLVTVPGCMLGAQRTMGYWPAHIWAKTICWLNFVRVKVTGRDNIAAKTSYVFVANHQGAFDIFSVYGYLNHNFKWMMKMSLRKIPFVGYTCYKAGHIFVDRSTPSALRRTMNDAEKQLSDGMSVVVFPEGSRSKDGKIHAFRRGAFMLAVEFGLPVAPITIDGAYTVMPKNAKLPRPGKITLTVHRPITAAEDGHDLTLLMEQSRQAIQSALPAENL